MYRSYYAKLNRYYLAGLKKESDICSIGIMSVDNFN
jgi:hypothetical protein